MSQPTIPRVELILGMANPCACIVDNIRDALEDAGVVFVIPNGLEPDARLKDKS